MLNHKRNRWTGRLSHPITWGLAPMQQPAHWSTRVNSSRNYQPQIEFSKSTWEKQRACASVQNLIVSYLFPLYQTLVLCCGINLADLGLIPSSTISLQSESRSAVTLRSHGLYSPWNSPGQNRVAFPFSRGIFPTQGSKPGLLHCRWILYQLSHKGSPRKLEWVAYPFWRRDLSDPGNQTGISCTAGGFFTNWAITWVCK